MLGSFIPKAHLLLRRHCFYSLDEFILVFILQTIYNKYRNYQNDNALNSCFYIVFHKKYKADKIEGDRYFCFETNVVHPFTIISLLLLLHYTFPPKRIFKWLIYFQNHWTPKQEYMYVLTWWTEKCDETDKWRGNFQRNFSPGCIACNKDNSVITKPRYLYDHKQTYIIL